MYKKSASVLVGAMLLITPLAASAQVVNSASNDALIASLRQLIVLLTQQLRHGSLLVTPTLLSSGQVLLTVGWIVSTNITVAGGNSTGASAAIDQNTLMYSSCKNVPVATITGTASNVDTVELTIVSTNGVAYGQGVLGAYREATVSNDKWSFPLTLGLAVGTYTVTVYAHDSGTVLATGILHLCAN